MILLKGLVTKQKNLYNKKCCVVDNKFQMRAVLKLLGVLEFSSCALKVLRLEPNLIMPFYAVARGRAPGIFMSWGDCEAQVKGFSGARYKKFDSIQSAQDFINVEGSMPPPSSKPKPSSSYNSFDNNPSINLKRSYSTSSNQSQKSNDGYEERNTSKASANNSYADSDFSDDSDDLDTILMKQMDDIEKRVNSFGKGVDKIIKKSSSGHGKKSSNRQRKSILNEPPQPKKQRLNNGQFEVDADGYVQVYTDGACSANGRSSARAGIGVFWGDGHELNTSEPVSGRATNNCGEIQAATHAIKQAVKNGVTQLTINTDSKFLINSVTKWMPGWKRKGWKLQSGEPVKNEKDFKDLDSVQKKLNIRWNYVEAHKGVHGNEMADQLAKAGAALYNK